MTDLRLITGRSAELIKFEAIRDVVDCPIPTEYVTKTTRYNNIYLFSLFQEGKKEKSDSRLLPERSLGCLRYPAYSATTTKEGNVIDIHLFHFGFSCGLR